MSERARRTNLDGGSGFAGGEPVLPGQEGAAAIPLDDGVRAVSFEVRDGTPS